MKREVGQPRSQVWVSRTLFLCCFVSSAILLGWAARFFSRKSEQQLGRGKFKAIAERVLAGARETLLRRRSSIVAMATLHGSLFPNRADWPFVALEDFDEIARQLGFTASGLIDEDQGLAVANFMSPDQVENFTTFQSDYLTTNYPHLEEHSIYQLKKSTYILPNGTVVARPVPDSKFTVVAPLTREYAPNTEESKIMLDLFSVGLYQNVIEYYLQQPLNDSNDREMMDCGVLSAPIKVQSDPAELGPSSIYTHPIYPADSRDQVSVVLSTLLFSL